MPLVIGGNSLNASPLLDQFNERQRFMQQQQQIAQHAQDEEQRQRDEAGRVKLQTQQGHDKDNNERARFLAQQNQAQQFHQDEQQHQQKQLDQQAQQADANRQARQDALDQQIQARQDAQQNALDVRKQFLEQQAAGANDRAETAHQNHLTGEMDRMTGAVEHAGRPDLVPRIAGEVQARDVLNQTDSPPDAPLVTGAEDANASQMNPFSMPPPIATELAQTQREHLDATAQAKQDAATEKTTKAEADAQHRKFEETRQTQNDEDRKTAADDRAQAAKDKIAAKKEPINAYQRLLQAKLDRLNTPEEKNALLDAEEARATGELPADVQKATLAAPVGNQHLINEIQALGSHKEALDAGNGMHQARNPEQVFEIGKGEWQRLHKPQDEAHAIRNAMGLEALQSLRANGKPQGQPPAMPEPVPAAQPHPFDAQPAPVQTAQATPPPSLLKEGVNTTMTNGQIWTLHNGIPTRVK